VTNRHRRSRKVPPPINRRPVSGAKAGLPPLYEHACESAEHGRWEEARSFFGELQGEVKEPWLKALIANDLAAIAAAEGDTEAAGQSLEAALAVDPECPVARKNLALIQSVFDRVGEGGRLERVAEGAAPKWDADRRQALQLETDAKVLVAILSFLFNWPSTGGGIVHTVELAQFLGRAGYVVQHVFARFEPWGIGGVEGTPPLPSKALEFDESTWSAPTIQARFRQAVDAFDPDYVIITDTWNMKPLLADVVRGYPYFLRFQALECLCPLNNLRLLAKSPERVSQCPLHQLATPERCHRCLDERGHQSGPLHQLERELAGVGTPEYDRALRRALEEAEAVLVLNPLTEAMLSPYARRVCVIPWGMDPARFPWPVPDKQAGRSPNGLTTIFMAAVLHETMKGFNIVHEACRRLRQSRSDFELVVTGDPPGQVDAFTRFVGWVSQEELPRHYRASDICVVPTIAQEGLSRTSVEAMASGIPVVASRIGGLPYTVADGATGLLFEPGNVDDLAWKLSTLLDDPPLRRRMALAGRRRFEEDFRWDMVIERYYRPLLGRRARTGANPSRP
jgi:glycosyltransferase involved in cell wall biosynthesis